MIQPAAPFTGGPVEYPESDGLPMADNSRQFRWIFTIAGNVAAQFRDRADVFVCGNQNWYPVEGHPEICQAPDVYAVFGRPKGERSSYKQWEEDHIPMTVVFEILSPRNTVPEMADKLAFYEEYGVEEYYVYDPETDRLLVYLRRGSILARIRQVDGFASPRLGIRFDTSGPELVIYYRTGERFLTFEELKAEQERERQERLAAEQRAKQAEERAEQAEQRAAEIEQRAEQAQRGAARLAELSRKARRGQAAPEELAELDRLEEA